MAAAPSTSCNPRRVPKSRSAQERALASARRSGELAQKRYTLADRVRSYVSVGAITFSPDGKRTAYWARSDLTHPGYHLVLDGEDGRLETERLMAGPIFSPDGRHVAYLIRDVGVRDIVVVDGEEFRPQSPLGSDPRMTMYMQAPQFLDSTHLYYVGLSRDRTGNKLVGVNIELRSRP